jgi:hypothetical protein
MAFPVSPTNGQTTVVNGISYIYASATNSWKKISSSVSNLAVTGNFVVSNVSAEVVTVSGNVSAANLTTTGNIVASYHIGDGSKLTNLPTTGATTGKAIAMAIVFGG